MGRYLVLLQIDVHVLLIPMGDLSFPQQKNRGNKLGVGIDRDWEKGLGEEDRRENAAWYKVNKKYFSKNVIFAL